MLVIREFGFSDFPAVGADGFADDCGAVDVGLGEFGAVAAVDS